MRRVSFAVNGVRHELELEPRELLVYFLRERLGLTGTNVGCDTSSCGACTVLLERRVGEVVHACSASRPTGRGDDDRGARRRTATLHPMQQAFHEQHALQCGYCTPGMVLAAVGILAENPNPSEDEIRHGARGQPLPLHRLPEHRQGRAGRGGG